MIVLMVKHASSRAWGLNILIAAALLGFGGWYVLSSDEKTEKSSKEEVTLAFKALEVEPASEQPVSSEPIVKGRKITISLGLRKTGGYSFRANKVVSTKEKILVYATEIPPGEGCIVTQAATYPRTTIELKQDITKPIELKVAEGFGKPC